MIRVTRLDGREFLINPDLIERLEIGPETIICLTTHNKFVVRESAAAITERIIAYRRTSREEDKPSQSGLVD